MFRLFFKNINKYSIEPLLHLRQTTSAKVCYRQDLTFLKYSKNLTQSISNRFVINSNYYRSYKNLRQCYINMLRANFCNKTPHLLKPWILNNFDNKAFFLLYEKDKAFYDLDYALIWRASQINSLFNLATTITRKKKKYTFKSRTFYITPSKRLLFVWKWFSVFMRTLYVKGLPRKFSLKTGLENFLIAPDNAHVITKFKLRIYKIYLLRIV
jgi:hypothetical protein